MTSEAYVTLVIGVLGVWIQVVILAFFLGRNKEKIAQHDEVLEDHETRIRSTEGRLTAAMGYKGLEGN